MLRSKALFGLSAIGFAGGIYVGVDNNRRRKTISMLYASGRIINLVSTVFIISGDYAYNMYLFPPQNANNKEKEVTILLGKAQTDVEALTLDLMANPEDLILKSQVKRKEEEISNLSDQIAEINQQSNSIYATLHTRNAQRLRDMCTNNKGIYIKIGQHLSMLDYILPDEYTSILATLLNKNPHSSFDSIRHVIRKDLGKFPEEIFERFQEEPLASASLAQVHVAYDKQGKKYAVKVQHEGLLESSEGDMLAITFIVNILSSIFKGFNYNFLAREMNANLPQELNFITEANNIAKIRKSLYYMIDSQDVVIPQVYSDYSGSRVLTMSFEEGFHATDLDAIQSHHLDKRDVARLLSRTFCEQIYRIGFIHCDPHEANVLIREHPLHKNRPQLVLLDHGLYKTLDDDFRRSYCRLWNGLIRGDKQEIELQCRNLKAGDAFPLLAAILTMRPWNDIVTDDVNRLHTKGSKGEHEMLKAYAKKYFKEVTGLLGEMPSDMLLLLKTNDCLRHIDRALGVPINTATVIGTTTANVLLADDIQHAVGIRGILGAFWRYLKTIVRIGALQMLVNSLSFWNRSLRLLTSIVKLT